MKWRFQDPPDTAVVTSIEVLRGGKPILEAYHHLEDGAWEFEGPSGAPDDEEELRVVSLEGMPRHDPTLHEIADLPLGWQASRPSLGSSWARSKMGP